MLRKIMFYSCVILAAIVFVLTAVCWINAAPDSTLNSAPYYCKFGVGQLLTQILLSMFTLLMLFGTLIGRWLRNWLHGPVLRLCVENDETHCLLIDGAPTDNSLPSLQPTLRIYAHVEDLSAAMASGCQLISNHVYASVDGQRFFKYCTWQTASFRWAHVPREELYSTSIRMSAEKYARIIEIVQREDSEESDSGSQADFCETSSSSVPQKRNVYSFITLLIPASDIVSKGTKIIIPTQYRSILLPIVLVCAERPAVLYYLRVDWKGVYVGDYKMPGFLTVKVLSKKEGNKQIS